jgi:hypothetical protein
MPQGAAEAQPNSVARFNVPGRGAMGYNRAATNGDGTATVRPRIARQGFTRFLTLADLDARTKAAQRARQVLAAIEGDLGGADRLSEGQRQLAQRAALISVQCEDYETRFLMGQPHELPDYLAACNCLRRVLASLGLERRARDVTPDVGRYLAEAAARHEAAEAAQADEDEAGS